jgi:hypothetical protein
MAGFGVNQELNALLTCKVISSDQTRASPVYSREASDFSALRAASELVAVSAANQPVIQSVHRTPF